MAINELRSISIFASAAELGSLRKAAAAHGISPQAASQALAQLEQHLDVRLVHRTTRVMSLTDEGQRFIESAKPALLGLQQALQTARRTKEEIAGPLRIVGPRSTFQAVLWRLLDEFCEQHPGIVPDVQLEDRVGNWVEDSGPRRTRASSRAACSRSSWSSARRPTTCAGTGRRRRWPSCSRTAAASSAIRPPGPSCPGASGSAKTPWNIPSSRPCAPTTRSWSSRPCWAAASSANWRA